MTQWKSLALYPFLSNGWNIPGTLEPPLLEPGTTERQLWDDSRVCFHKHWKTSGEKKSARASINLKIMKQIKSNQYSFNWQNTTIDTDAKVVYIIPKLLDGRRTK